MHSYYIRFDIPKNTQKLFREKTGIALDPHTLEAERKLLSERASHSRLSQTKSVLFQIVAWIENREEERREGENSCRLELCCV